MNEQNLKPFQPGQSGNPKGKSKGCGWSIPSRLRHILEKNAPDVSLATLEKHGIKVDLETSGADVVAMVLYLLASAGDVSAATLILEYLESKPTKGVRLEQMRFTVAPMPPPDGEGFDDDGDFDDPD